MGRMAPYKGAREAALIARAAGVRLLLAAKVDEPAEQDYFQTQVEPLLGEGIEFLGEIGGQQRLDLLGNAIGMINPISWDEPFGLVMVEAMACGTPVLAFPNGAAPEIVDDGSTGLLCQPTSTKPSAGCPSWPTLTGPHSRLRVEQHFSTDRMVDEHLDGLPVEWSPTAVSRLRGHASGMVPPVRVPRRVTGTQFQPRCQTS